MPTPVLVPKNEMSQETATLVEWLKKTGDAVEKGEPIYVVETDKVTVEVESPASGILGNLQAAPGDVVPVTTQIAVIWAEGEDRTVVPAGTVAPVVIATPVAQRMAAQENVDLKLVHGSGPSGKITRHDVEAALQQRVSGSADNPVHKVDAGKRRASPAARRIAMDKHVNLEQVSGTGPQGRIQGWDVQVIVEQATRQEAQPPNPEPVTAVGYRAIPVTGMRKRIAERMLESVHNAPQITFTSRIDVTRLMALRSSLNQRAASSQQTSISMTALLAYVVARVLTRHEWINAGWIETPQGAEIRLFPMVNLGIAVALPEGLIVPVIHAAQQTSLQAMATQVQSLADKARNNQLTPAEVSGGTFTISNLGPYGIEAFTALLNPGQAGILAVGAANQEPVQIDGKLEFRPLMRLTLTVDHRIVDGAVAANFMADLKAAIEEPGLLLL